MFSKWLRRSGVVIAIGIVGPCPWTGSFFFSEEGEAEVSELKVFEDRWRSGILGCPIIQGKGENTGKVRNVVFR